MLSECPGKKDIFKELRARFVIFLKIIISEKCFVSYNFVSEGTIESALQNRFWRPQQVGLVWSMLISSKGYDRVWMEEGGDTSWVGGI